MALFAQLKADDVDLLLATGFTAHLHRRGRYVGVNDGELVLGAVERAASLHFCGNAQNKRAAVRCAPRSFLHVDERQCTERPVVVCVQLSAHGDVLRVTLSDTVDEECYLTLPPSTATESCKEDALFDVQVLHVGAAEWKRTPPPNGMFASQAVLRAALLLGLRFRLRSVHGRVLRVCDKRQRVVQNGPRTTLTEAHESELVFEPTQRGESHHLFRVVSAGAKGALHLALCRGSDDTPHAVVVAGDDPGAGALLTVDFARKWSTLHVGLADDNGVEWLMAGARGRLETRRHKRAWETLSVEYVVQTRSAALQQTPLSAAFKEADNATRRRAAVAHWRASKAASKRASSSATATAAASPSKPVRQFDHTRALAALSSNDTDTIVPAPDVVTPSPPVEDAPISAEQSVAAAFALSASAASAPRGENEDSNSPSSTSAVAARQSNGSRPPTEAGTLPRNAQNKKLSKREKRKKRRQAQGVNPAPPNAAKKKGGKSKASASNPGASTSAGAGPSTSSQDEAIESTPSGVTRSDNASRSSPAPPANGPTCGACGRVIIGEYTTALGKSFHPGCLVCARCRCTLFGAGRLHMHSGAPHCARCYETHCAPRCARCTKPILGTVVTAMDKTWHRECLTCVDCRQPLGERFWIYAHKPREPHCNDCMGGAAPNGSMLPPPRMGSDTMANGTLGDMPAGGARIHIMPSLNSK